MANRDIYVATRTFVTEVNGVRTVITAGKTFVRAGHEILEGRETLFRKIEPQYEVASRRSPRSPLPEVVPDDAELLED